MKAAMSDDAAKAISEMWGIDVSRCTGLEINIHLFPQKVARVQIHKILAETEVEGLREILETYHLVKEEPEP